MVPPRPLGRGRHESRNEDVRGAGGSDQPDPCSFYEVVVFNPMQTHAFTNTSIRGAKTDSVRRSASMLSPRTRGHIGSDGRPVRRKALGLFAGGTLAAERVY